MAFFSGGNSGDEMAEPTYWRWTGSGRSGRQWQNRWKYTVFYLRYDKNYGSARVPDLYYILYPKLFSAGENQENSGEISRNMG